MKYGWDPISDLKDSDTIEKIILIRSIVPNDFKDSIHIKEKERIKIKVNIMPENATNKTLTWASSNNNIATVNDSGVVTAIQSGGCHITANSNDGSDISSSIFLKVKEHVETVKVVSIGLKKYLEIEVGKSVQIESLVNPQNATNKSLEWESSNPNVARIEHNTGKLYAVSEGRCEITVHSTDGSRVSAKCNVKVNLPIPAVDNPEVTVKQWLADFNNKELANKTSLLFAPKAIVKIYDDGVITDRIYASEYIGPISRNKDIIQVKFVDIKINNNNKIEELTVEEVQP